MKFFMKKISELLPRIKTLKRIILLIAYLDYTGCYTSGGSSMKGYNQSVYDIDEFLDYIDADKRFEDMPNFLFGHSMGAYAV